MSEKIDSTMRLMPRWDANGLITAVCTDARSGALLMVAHMNADALAATLETKRATFWSRSRQSLWIKGETSAHFLDVEDVLIDCDQDCLWLKCVPHGPACHTGADSCFFRRIEDGALVSNK